MVTTAPPQLAQRHLDTVLANLPGVFDGDIESIHQARIATRRLREVLPLMTDAEQVTTTIRTAGQQFGLVRELDVMSRLLESLSDRVPTVAAIELHTLRQTVRKRRDDARRAMVKALEKLDLPSLRDAFVTNGSWLRRNTVGTAIRLRPPSWVGSIWMRIIDRKDQAVRAIERAPAVYLPNRTHQARIGVKKLRYAVEVAADTGVWNPPRVLKDLRRLQGVLGEEHDLQVLMDLVNERPAENGAAADDSVISILLMADIRRLHAEYARQRQRVFKIADVCTHAAGHSRRRIPVPLVAAAMFTAPLVLESFRPQRQLGARATPHLVNDGRG